jgi:hypothetical protein
VTLRWFLADLRTGRILLDVQPLAGNWERYLNAPERLTATMDLRDPNTIDLRLRQSAAPGRTILACAAGDTVIAAGPIWAHRYSRAAKTLQLVAVGMWSYFDYRYVLPVAAATLDVTQFTIPDPSAAGKTQPNPAVGTYLVGWEYGTIAKKWVQQAQTWTGGNVPVVFEADRAGTRERNFEGVDFKKLGTVLSQLTEIDGGPDIRFMPRLTPDRLSIEFLLQTGTDASPLLTGGPHLWDVTAPDSAISTFDVEVDATQMGSVGWASGGRSADTALIGRSVDPTLTNAGYPLLEMLDASHSTVVERATLDPYAVDLTTLGRSPVETWDFSVEADRQPFLGAYWEGDWCEVSVAGYDPSTGMGDPYLYEKQDSKRRITGMSGDEKGLAVSVKTMARI